MRDKSSNLACALYAANGTIGYTISSVLIGL